MSKLAAASLAAVLAVAGGAAFEAPAAAQQRGVLQVVVFGDDPCPRSSDDEVVVCARRPEAERYRIPEEYRAGGSRQANQSWVANARSLETVGKTGIMSCSPVGPAGHTGCLEQLIKQSMGDRRESDDSDRPPE